MIARHVAIAFLIYAALVLQPSLGHGLGHALFRPWLPGIALVVCVLLTNGVTRLIWSGLLGLGIDCLSGDRLGIHMMTATLIASGLVVMTANGASRTIIAIGSLAFTGTFVWRIASAIVDASLDHHAITVKQIAIPAIAEGLSTATLLIGVMLICRLLTNAIRPQAASSMSLTNQWSMLTGG